MHNSPVEHKEMDKRMQFKEKSKQWHMPHLT